MPVQQPCQISQGNGGRLSHTDEFNRYAWDFNLTVGSPVVATRSGVVVRVKDDSYRGGPDTKWLSAGNEIVLDHLDGEQTLYLHLSPNAVVKEGEYVLQGQLLGQSGWTGYAHVPHLHYTVQTEDRISVASKFVDYPQTDGVPNQENVVKPARPPAVPQDVIDAYRAAWSGCAEAERLGAPDLALEFARIATKKRSKYKDYFYHQVLANRAKLHRQTVTDRAAEIFNATERDKGDIADLMLLKITLAQSKDRTLRTLAQSLGKTLKEYPDDVRARWKKATQALEELVAALRAECSGDTRRALDHYIKALELRSPTVGKRVQDAFARFAEERNQIVVRKLSALASQVKDTGEGYLEQLREAAGAHWHTHDLLLDVWERRVADSGVAPIEARARTEAIMKRIRGR